jgi:uncharacterized membrane protein
MNDSQWHEGLDDNGAGRQGGDDPGKPPALPAGPSDGEGALVLDGIRTLHDRLGRLERLLVPEDRVVREAAREITPAWKRVTEGEYRWQVTAATLAAIALQLPLTGRLVLLKPNWLLPALQGLLFVVLVVVNPRRINRESRAIRFLSLTLAGFLSVANGWSAARMVVGLVQGTEGSSAGPLLISGGAIWLTNIIVFALWYWEFDRGGPVARANAVNPYPDFQFVQMANPELAPPHWEPAFGDYLYLAFTNAAAFSPTDVMPLSRWAKMAMLLQSAISIVTVALVIARAVNILK